MLLLRHQLYLASVPLDGRPPAALPEIVEMEALNARTGATLWGPLEFRIGDIFQTDLWIRPGLDLDGDAAPDVAVFEVDFALTTSRLYAVAGSDGHQLWHRVDAGAGIAGFRYSPAAGIPVPLGVARDFDGDGRSDFVLGRYSQAALWHVALALGKSVGPGGAWLLTVEAISGAGGEVLGLPRTAVGFALAPAAAPVGDLTGDGLTDLVVASVYRDASNRAVAMTTVYGRARDEVWTRTYFGSPGTKDFGLSLWPARIRGGAQGDFVLGFDTNADMFGAKQVIGVASTGESLFNVFMGDGSAFTIPGDVNGDGKNDVRTASLHFDSGWSAWITRTFATAPTSPRIWSYNQRWDWGGHSSQFLVLEISVGDLDGDGVSDQMTAGSQWWQRGTYVILSGRTGAVLWTWEGGAPEYGLSAHVLAARASLGGLAGDDALLWWWDYASSEFGVTAVDGPNRAALWAARRPGAVPPPRMARVTTTEVTGDGTADLIVAGSAEVEPLEYVHYLVAINGRTGAVLWTR